MVAQLLVAAILASTPAGLKARGYAPTRGDVPQSQEVVAEIRVHGNHITADEDVIKIAQVAVGDRVTPTLIAEVTARLKASKKFDEIDVLKRFASIADPTKISIVLIVNEGPVRIEVPNDPTAPLRVVRRGYFRRMLYMPILDGEDGYGLTYGMRFAFVNVAGKQSRLSFPATWGGMKRIASEFDRTFATGPISRIEVGGAVQRQRNPAFDLNDDRRRVWARVERAAGPVRVGGIVGWQHVSFAAADDSIRSVGADVAFDTRIDPLMPRNAIYAKASWEHLRFASGSDLNRTRVEANGYIGLFRQNVLVLRAEREDTSDPLPLYLKSLLGGWSNLRGYHAGAFFGDTLVASSIEVRIPVSSPISVGKLGFSVFVDAGKVYDKGARFEDQPLRRGIGGSVWLIATVFHMSLSVAHGNGAGTRANFGVGISF